MAKLRILHIGKYYEPFKGGIETFLRDLVESHTMQEHCDLSVLAHHHQTNQLTRNELINGVNVTRVKLWRRLVFAPICPTFLKELNRSIDKNAPDVLHIHMPNLSAFACLLSKRARQRPWIIHWHADVLGSAPDWRVKILYPLYRIFEKALLKYAKTIICTSPPYLESSQALAGYKHKCVVIPLGLRANAPPHDRTNPNTTDPPTPTTETLKLLMIGRLTYYKGHELLLQAIRELNNIELTIIGEGELRPQIEQRIKEWGLSDRVAVLGKVSDEDIETAIEQCDLVALPSLERTEAFGLVILEAARRGKPALAARVPGSGMGWVVVHNQTGWSVTPNSAAELTRQINHLSQHRGLIAACGQSARSRFAQHFTIEGVAKSLLKTYLSVTPVSAANGPNENTAPTTPGSEPR